MPIFLLAPFSYRFFSGVSSVPIKISNKIVAELQLDLILGVYFFVIWFFKVIYRISNHPRRWIGKEENFPSSWALIAIGSGSQPFPYGIHPLAFSIDNDRNFKGKACGSRAIKDSTNKNWIMNVHVERKKKKLMTQWFYSWESNALMVMRIFEMRLQCWN